MNRLAQRFAKGPILGAEGYLFELERRGWVSIGPFVPEVVLDSPDAVKQLHREFVRSGSDVIEAFTYYGHREKLRLINKEHILKDLNVRAIEIANEVRNEFYELYPTVYNTDSIENELLVAGNICNSTLFFGKEDTNNYQQTIAEIKSQFMEQVEWSLESGLRGMSRLNTQNTDFSGQTTQNSEKNEKNDYSGSKGVDFFIGETYDYLEEALIALDAIKSVENTMPCVINMAIHSCGTTLDGFTPESACEILANEGADCVGLNCARGPDTMLPLLRRIKERVGEDVPIAALPVCYRTSEESPTFQSLSNVDDPERKLCDLDHHVCTRFDIFDFTKECLDLGIKYLGVCCGGAPHHVRSMAEAMGRAPLSSKYNPNLGLHFALGSKDDTKINNYL